MEKEKRRWIWRKKKLAKIDKKSATIRQPFDYSINTTTNSHLTPTIARRHILKQLDYNVKTATKLNPICMSQLALHFHNVRIHYRA